MIPARLRLGVVPLNGRVAGHADQCVHLFPMAEGRGVPSRMRAYCGLIIEPAMAEVVSAASGAPCVTCMLAASKPRWSPDGLVY